MAERNGGGVMRESLRESLMGHVTDGGLEPEPVVSIKAASRPVNRFLALEYGDFGLILGTTGDLKARGRGMGQIPARAGMTVE